MGLQRAGHDWLSLTHSLSHSKPIETFQTWPPLGVKLLNVWSSTSYLFWFYTDLFKVSGQCFSNFWEFEDVFSSLPDSVASLGFCLLNYDPHTLSLFHTEIYEWPWEFYGCLLDLCPARFVPSWNRMSWTTCRFSSLHFCSFIHVYSVGDSVVYMKMHDFRAEKILVLPLILWAVQLWGSYLTSSFEHQFPHLQDGDSSMYLRCSRG